jgi:hypothetical protein
MLPETKIKKKKKSMISKSISAASINDTSPPSVCERSDDGIRPVNVDRDYEIREFLLINAPGTLQVRITNAVGGITTKQYRHGALIQKDTAPDALLKMADNPICFFYGVDHSGPYFKIETVQRPVHKSRGLITSKNEKIITEHGDSVAPVVLSAVSRMSPERIMMNAIKEEIGLTESE